MKQIHTTFTAKIAKGLAFFLAFLLTTKQDNAQICSSPSTVIYALSNAGSIYPVTVSNGAVAAAVNTTSLNSTSSANAIGYNTENGLFYYFQNANNGSSQQFVSYNPATSTYTILASAPTTAISYKGCVSFNGTGYYCIDAKGNLCYYDITSNTWALIGSSLTDQFGNNVTTVLSSEASGDMAIDGLGNLWIVTSSTSSWGLYKLAAPLPTSATSSLTVQQLVAPTTATPTGANFAGIAFDPLGDIYMGTNNDLYLLNHDFSLSHLASFSTAGICGDLTSCNYPFSVLAVSFQSFTATAGSNETVSVSWSMAQQTTTKGYYVERSTDGTDWSELSFVVSQENAGNVVKYTYTDNKPYSGINYYRIHEVELDGSDNYSTVRSVTLAENTSSVISLWPNPARDAIKIRDNGSEVVARIYNQSGALVGETTLQSGTNTLNISMLAVGAYIVNIQQQNGQYSNLKFIKY